jgi:hypothetical protein
VSSADNIDKAALEAPKGAWGSILTMTPIVLTILATAFAGLSSSEMTQSMYFRSLAAQHQSKAGDQWAFFQAKRIRGTNLEMTVQLLQSLAHPLEFDPLMPAGVSSEILKDVDRAAGGESGPKQKAAADALPKVKKAVDNLNTFLAKTTTQEGLTYLTNGKLPAADRHQLEPEATRNAIMAVVEAVRDRKTEGDTAALVAKVKAEDVEEATRIVEDNAERFDKASKPVTDTIRGLEKALKELTAAVRPLSDPALDRSQEALNTSFRVAALDFDARRYREEAKLNGEAADMYEVRVRRSGLTSDMHRDRSKKFFYSMLMAQAGVTVSSLALAGAKRSWLWLFAAVAGVVAVAFSAYVYLGI